MSTDFLFNHIVINGPYSIYLKGECSMIGPFYNEELFCRASHSHGGPKRGYYHVLGAGSGKKPKEFYIHIK